MRETLVDPRLKEIPLGQQRKIRKDEKRKIDRGKMIAEVTKKILGEKRPIDGRVLVDIKKKVLLKSYQIIEIFVRIAIHVEWYDMVPILVFH